MMKNYARLFVLLLLAASANGPLQAQYSTYEDLLIPGTPNSAYDMSITVNPDNRATAHVLLGPTVTSQERYLVHADSTGTINWNVKQPLTSSSYTIDYTAAIRIPGGYFDCAYASDNVNSARKEVCIKTSANGTPVWAKSYQVPSMTFRAPTQCGQLNDGSFVVAGDVISGAGITYVHLMRLDSMGNVLWSQVYTPTTNTQEHAGMTVTPAQCIVVTTVRSDSNPILGSSVARVRANGSLHWARRFVSGPWLFPVDVKSTPEDSLWIMSKIPDGQNNKNPAIIKTDSLGQVAWGKQYTYTGYDLTPAGCITTRDKGLVIFGTISSTLTTPHSYLMKVDAQGNLLWTVSTPSILIKSIAETPSGGIAYVATDIMGNNELIMGRKDPAGRNACDTTPLPFTVVPLTVTWQPDSSAAAFSAAAVVLTYTVYSYNFADSALCNNTIGISEPTAADLITIAPNPAGDHIRISGLQGQNTIKLYNSRGQLCMNQVTRSEEQWIDLSQFAEGLYFVSIENGQQRITRKVIIQR